MNSFADSHLEFNNFYPNRPVNRFPQMKQGLLQSSKISKKQQKNRQQQQKSKRPKIKGKFSNSKGNQYKKQKNLVKKIYSPVYERNQENENSPFSNSDPYIYNFGDNDSSPMTGDNFEQKNQDNNQQFLLGSGSIIDMLMGGKKENDIQKNLFCGDDNIHNSNNNNKLDNQIKFNNSINMNNQLEENLNQINQGAQRNCQDLNMFNQNQNQQDVQSNINNNNQQQQYQQKQENQEEIQQFIQNCNQYLQIDNELTKDLEHKLFISNNSYL